MQIVSSGPGKKPNLLLRRYGCAYVIDCIQALFVIAATSCKSRRVLPYKINGLVVLEVSSRELDVHTNKLWLWYWQDHHSCTGPFRRCQVFKAFLARNGYVV